MVFGFEQKLYRIHILNVLVYPQCYAAVAGMLPTFGKKALVTDVGSWTVDSMLIVNKKPDNSRCDTQNEGLIKCMRAINRVAVQVKNRKIDEAEIQEYMKTGKTELPKDFKEIMAQQIHEFVDKVYRYQTECGYSLDMIPVYFVGGGAVVMRNFGKYQQSNIHYVLDVKSNAKGLETKAKQALKCIKGLETRKYEELFENCILKDRRLQRDDICETECNGVNTKQRFSVEPTLNDKGGEDTMINERKYTPFDGKENDWLSFAKQQAEFYRNAGQYITNLRIDIKEIDDEIEDIFLETEDANCNVAQGYKVFKRLKDLRLEKKVKTRELNCLYALTDYIDCESLADTCDDNLAEVEGIMGVPEHNEVTELRFADNEQEENMHVVENIKDMVG